METIKVRINPDCITATEFNRLPFPYFEPKFVGDIPLKDYTFNAKLRMWQEEEDKLRIFSIANSGEVYADGGVDIFRPHHPKITYEKIGSIHSAEIIDKEKLIIRIC